MKLKPHGIYEDLTDLETAQKNVDMIIERVAQLEVEKLGLLGQLGDLEAIVVKAKPTSRIAIINLINDYMASKTHWKNPRETLRDQMKAFLGIRSAAIEIVTAHDAGEDSAACVEHMRDELNEFEESVKKAARQNAGLE